MALKRAERANWKGGGRRGRRRRLRFVGRPPAAVADTVPFLPLHLLSPRLLLFFTHSLFARMPAVTVEPLLPPQPTSMTLFIV